MKKKPVLLLEILIAFTFVELCIIPLVRRPLKMYKEEMSRFVEMEQQRLADWTFTEIKEMFLKNEIKWQQIPSKKEKSARFDLPPATLQIPGASPKAIQRSFVLTGRGEILGKQGEIYRQLGVYIHLNEKKYSFRIPVQKVSVE